MNTCETAFLAVIHGKYIRMWLEVHYVHITDVYTYYEQYM